MQANESSNLLYSNGLLDTIQLPDLPEDQFESIEPNWKKQQAIFGGLLIAFLSIPVPIALYFVPDEPLDWMWYAGIGGLVTLLLIWVIIFPFLAYSKIGYRLRTHDISYKKGLIWRKLITISYNRIQHLEISQGPVQKSFGLATLQLFTAGGQTSDMEIEGLSEENARKLKDWVSKKSGVEVEEEQ